MHGVNTHVIRVMIELDLCVMSQQLVGSPCNSSSSLELANIAPPDGRIPLVVIELGVCMT
jgi:hypothetical protein